MEGVAGMKIYIVYREDAYGSYTVMKLFYSYDDATRYIETLDLYEKGLHSIEEDTVE